jgi:hypothetical protein
MSLFIKVVDGQPVGHPMLEENLRQVIPDFDPNNPPFDFVKFERVPPPHIIGVYQIHEGTTYVFDGGVVKDKHSVRNMTAEEIAAKQNLAKELFARDVGYSSWIFNPSTCAFDPPVPRPTDGLYKWDEATTSWLKIVE